jgi:hypothetical protein
MHSIYDLTETLIIEPRTAAYSSAKNYMTVNVVHGLQSQIFENVWACVGRIRIPSYTAVLESKSTPS